MRILILGGTGAMGKPLVSILSQSDDVYVTSRVSRQSIGNIHYIQGNARDLCFLRELLSGCYYDVIVDFMVWEDDFKDALPILLTGTSQYVFISSARVYAQSDSPITEKSPRLLEVSDDVDYLSTNEYALAKAREEDILYQSGRKNFTIIRPSITYNDQRLQLGVLEKENWLYRALKGRSIVFSEDIADKITTMTLGDDVAKGISSIIGQQGALGEAFHITCNYALRWRDVLEVYLDVLEKHLGKRSRVVWTKKSTSLMIPYRIYQVIYGRYFNRTFDNTKISNYCNVSSFTDPRHGLADCLERFLQNPQFQEIDWHLEALNDSASGEHARLSEMKNRKERSLYIRKRYKLRYLRAFIHFARNIIK